MEKSIFKFSSITIPEFIEQIDKKNNYYRLGIDNHYYDYLIKLYKESSTHASMCDNQVQRIVGTGFISDDPINTELIKKYKINDWLLGVSNDFVKFGGFTTEISWNLLHEKILEFNKVNIDRIRIGLIDEESQDEPNLYFYSPYFSDYTYSKRNKNIEVLYKFDTTVGTSNKQLLYNYGTNRIGDDIYPRPDYSAGVSWIEAEKQIPLYYMNLIYNNFNVSNILVVPYMVNESDKQRFENSLKERFVGVDNAASTLVLYSPNDGTEVKLINTSGDQGEKKYDELYNLCVESISRAHRIPSPFLCGLSLPGNLFGISDLPFIEKMYNKQVIYPKRQKIINTFEELNKYLITPITSYTIEDLNIFDNEKNI